MISVIIPLWKEQHIINQTLFHVWELARHTDIEIIVVDGDPLHQTINIIRDQRVKKIISPKGRGIQMNTGAKYASGDLLFLHADTQLPDQAFEFILQTLENNRYAGGAFDLNIDAPGAAFRIIETAASWRSRLTRIPYGDQAIFLRKRIFDAIGGYRPIPLMEDVDLMRRIKKQKYNIRFIPSPVKTSARKWRQDGILTRTLKNWYITLLFFARVSPSKLVKYY